MGLLDGKIAIVTGAGGGIGRCHALALAREGAGVVVNDLGGSRDGTGQTATAADQVVAEIRELGGDAIANGDSVSDFEGCQRMVQSAVDRWGHLDAVVNNAGILRDKTFVKMTQADWDLVLSVHLTGTRNITRAALDALMKQGGAIINTTSYSGMIGNFGQSNYAAAKAGIYGLTRVLSMELRKFGVTANCIAPIAKTRMTEDIAMVEADWKPEQISPIVVFLASDLAKNVTGQVFGVQGQRINVYEVKVSDGVEKSGDSLWTAEEIASNLSQISSFDLPSTAPTSNSDDRVTQVFSHFPAGYKTGAVPGWKSVLHWVVKGGADQTVIIDDAGVRVTSGLKGTASCTIKADKSTLLAMFTGELDPTKAFMSGKATADNMGDLMKLAMAFDFSKVAASFSGGASAPVAPAPVAAAPVAEKVIPIGKRYDGGYWLVRHDDFQAYAAATDDSNPRYTGDDAVAPPMFHVRPFIGLMMKLATDPELDLDVLRLVHGEHFAQFHRTLRHGDILHLRGELESLEEKGSGRVATFGLYGFVEGNLAIECKTTYFVRGKPKEGGGEKKVAPATPSEPPPPPDWMSVQVITDDQPKRYAIASGDDNPIHTDPTTARAAGLPGVIAHGLCTMALAQRDIIQTSCGGDPRRLAAIGVRWARPVLPGQSLTLKCWNDGGTVRFVTENTDGQAVVTHGRAEIR